MNLRPKSVTVICWLVILSAFFGIFTLKVMINPSPQAADLMSKNLLPVSIQRASVVVGVLICILCGVFMLNGKNWARSLYVGWVAFGIIVGLLTSPVKLMLIPSILVFAIFAFFLFRPKANAYFSGASGQ